MSWSWRARCLAGSARRRLAGLGIVLLGLASATADAAVTPSIPEAWTPSTWTVTVEGESRSRRLEIGPETPGMGPTRRLPARYGWSDAPLQKVVLELTQDGETLGLALTTPARGRIVATETGPAVFEGLLTTQQGVAKPVRLVRLPQDASAAGDAARGVGASGGSGTSTRVREPVALSRVHMVYMGSSDCPPCSFWMAHDLPRLRAEADFRAIRYSKVEKVIKSPVPPLAFLPDEVKPIKARLDHASSGAHGSAQVAILVDQEIFDYYLGTRTAEQVLAMLQALRTGAPYPYARCLKIVAGGACAQPAP